MSQGRLMEQPKKKRTKTKDKLLALSKEESDKIGLQVIQIMEGELKSKVNSYIYKYEKSCKNVWGWEREDVKQYITEVIWKGVVTFSPEKKIPLKGYLSTILYYQMGNLSKTLQSKRNALTKLYCPEELFDAEETTIDNSSEDWHNYMRSFGVLKGKLTPLEKKILSAHLLGDLDLRQTQKHFNLKREEVLNILMNMRDKMEQVIQGE